MDEIQNKLHKAYYDFYSKFCFHRNISPADCIYMDIPIYVDHGYSSEAPKLAWIMNLNDFRRLADNLQNHVHYIRKVTGEESEPK